MDPNHTAIETQVKAVALAILEELQLPYLMQPNVKAKDIAELCPEPLARTALCFQTHDYQDAPKALVRTNYQNQFVASAAPIQGASVSDPTVKASERFFCTVEYGYVSTSNVDIDHATAYEEIIKRQREFLEFLNHPTNKE